MACVGLKIVVIIHFENGRLGNQLFQYCGFRQYYKEHRLIIVGCESLKQHFEFKHAYVIPQKAFRLIYIFKLFKKLVFLLLFVRILSKISEEKDANVFKPVIRRGLIANILVSQNVFFQHQNAICNIESFPRLNQSVIDSAHEWLRSNEIKQHSSHLIFLHVRRGDYLNWPSRNFPAVLDAAWYKRSIEFMRQLYDSPKFILMGDDYFYMHDVFGGYDDIAISCNTLEVDMALMSLCNSGILSASSFGWWGAFFARVRQHQDAVFLAPRYWAGHRIGKWLPAGFITDWITYLD